MATKTSSQELSSLGINLVKSKTAFNQMVADNQINADELYLIEGEEAITYSFADGTAGNFTVTPSTGSAQTVNVGKPAAAGTADSFAAAQTITLTGDVTGSNSSTAGWSIGTTLANSGVTANTYGNTSQQTPSHGGTFNIPYFTVDAKGRLTSAGTTTVKLPTDNNTDTLVKQSASTSNSNFKLLFTTTASPTSGTAYETYYDTGITVNPSTDTITATTFAGNASTADKVNHNLVLKIKSGSTEGTDLYTFNGSTAKTLDIKAGSNITLTAAAGEVTIAATDTTYSAMSVTEMKTGTAITGRVMRADYLKSFLSTLGGTYLTLSHDATNGIVLNHDASGVTAGTYGSATQVPAITIDTQGHITGVTATTITNTATAADNILDGSNSGTEITYAPYSSQQSKLSFDTSSTNPTRTDRLNLNGYLYATKLYSGGAEVLTAHQSLADYLTKAAGVTAVSWDSTNKKITRTINGTAADVLQFVAGSNITLTAESGKLTIASSYTNSRDPGYGKIKAGTASTATTAITANTSTAEASTYNETLTINPGNKWIAVAASNSSTAGSDTFTIAHSTSGATAGDYGDSSNQTPAYGGTFNVPYISIDAGGHVTGISTHTVTIPASDNTDYKVRQTNDASTNANYRLLLSNSANDTQEDNISRKNSNLIYNPSTNLLSTGNLKLTGEIDVTGDAYLRNETYADSLTAGSLQVTGNANFVQIPTAPTATAGTANTQLATTEFVTTAVGSGFAANDAMVFKGTLGTAGSVASLPTNNYSAGWTYRVATAGTYAGEYCEVGDLIIAINDGPTSGTSVVSTDWAKIEHNIDGALYKTSAVSYTGDKVLLSSGTGGAVKEGSISTETVIKTATFSAGSVPTLGTAISADDITAWSAGSTPTLGTAFSVPNVTGNTSVTASYVTKTDNTVVKTISQAASTSSVIGTVSNGVLTLSSAITAVGAVTAGSTATASAVTITDVTATNVTLGTAFSIPNVTSVGSAPSLNYTSRSIPNVTSVGTAPSLSTTTQSVITGIS